VVNLNHDVPGREMITQETRKGEFGARRELTRLSGAFPEYTDGRRCRYRSGPLTRPRSTRPIGEQ